VIGAGPSGLAAARCLLDAAYVPIVFERSSSIGGIWRFDEAVADGGGPAYRSLRTNTPKQLTAFSDMPFDDTLPPFPSRAAVAEYLQRYAERHDLLRHIRFETPVERIAPAGERTWSVHVTTPHGAVVELVDAVFVCSGMYDDPQLPHIAGLESFPGVVLHSRAYRDAEPFANRRVLVVGTGSSSVDIAADTGGVAAQVWLSGRNDAWKLQADDAPTPAVWRERLRRHIRLRLGGRMSAIGDAPFVPHRDRTKLNDRLRELIGAGRVLPSSGVERIDGATVYFANRAQAEVDAIIFATGYSLRFPFLDRSILDAPPEGLALFRTVLHPDYPTLFFIGMSRATGPIPPLGEMQARWATQVLRGTLRPPAPPAMHRAIRRRRQHVARVGGNPYRLLYEPYMDLLAAELGVLPRLWRHPRLVRRLLNGPFLAARFRLDGPGCDPRAEQFLRTGRLAQATQGTQGIREKERRGDEVTG